jgi:glycosyltransferase involved in cell wall biosynthesis
VASRALGLLPPRIRTPLADALRLQLHSWLALGRALRAATRRPADAKRPAAPTGATGAFAVPLQAGDILLNLGSPWWRADHAGLVAQVRATYRIRFAQLIYDLIPVRHPEWCDGNVVTTFRRWIKGVLPLCDAVLTISEATAGEVKRYAEETGIVLPPVWTLPIGTGFGAAAEPRVSSPSRHLPEPGTYALFVSTIEARKNHALLFRVWRRLLAEGDAAKVPTLVFAGSVGWLVADLLQQIDNAACLDGRLVIVADPTDAELTALYKGCLFTLFPSFAEGWGLPVTESLAFGKPCIISDRSSLPEAGGALARYFDPDDVNDAHRVIRAVIEDRDALAAWTALVGRAFRPVPWDAAAQVILRALAPELMDGGVPGGILPGRVQRD